MGFKDINKMYGTSWKKDLRIISGNESGIIIGTRGMALKVHMDNNKRPRICHPFQNIKIATDGDLTKLRKHPSVGTAGCGPLKITQSPTPPTAPITKTRVGRTPKLTNTPSDLITERKKCKSIKK